MAKNVVAKMMIDGAVQDLMLKTGSDNVIVDASTGETLSTRLASILTDIAATITPAEVDTKISAAIDELIAGAPDTYDTLKEIADYIASNETVVDALNSAIANKVDKVSGKGLSTNDLTDALLTKLNGIAAGATKVAKSTTNGNILVNDAEVNVYTHPTTAGNKHIPAGGSAGQILEYSAAGTAQWADPKTEVRSGASVPSDLAEGELFLQILN